MQTLTHDFRTAEPFLDFLGDLATLGVKPVASTGTAYAVIPARSNPRWWLLPLQNAGATAAGLEMLQPVTRAARLSKCAARLITKAGAYHLITRKQIHLSGPPQLAGAFRGAVSHVAYFTGTHGPHRKTTIQVMDANGVVLGYAKASRSEHIKHYLRHEAHSLAQVKAMRLESADVPTVKAYHEEELALLVTDSLKSAAHNSPKQITTQHVTFLRELQARSERPNAYITLELIRRQSNTLGQLAGAGWQKRLERVADVLTPYAQELTVCLAHGDFTPWNCFLENRRLYVFDWEYANEKWPVGYDLAHYQLATTSPHRHVDIIAKIVQMLSTVHFNNDDPKARRALLFSIACHATFYLKRLSEVRATLSDWPEASNRATLIDRLIELTS